MLAPLVEILDACLALTGLWLAWTLYSPTHAPHLGRSKAFAAGLGLDAAYTRFLAVPYARLAAFLWRGVDMDVLDGLPTALASGTVSLAEGLRSLTTGRVSVSLTVLLAAAAAVMTWLALGWT
jgi:NADH-quinone oxidoreductase subunit L